MAGYGAGAAQGLEQLIAEMYQKQLLAQQANRDQSAAELGQGNLRMREREFDAATAPQQEKPVVVNGRLVMPSTGTVVYEPPAQGEKPVNVGNRLVMPSTGKVVYEPPTTPLRPTTVSPGAQLVDPTTGRVIFRAPHAPERGAAGPSRADDPSLPRGVQDYLVQLRAKYPTFEAASTELSEALGSLRSAHPSLSSAKALNELRAQYSGSANPRPAKTTAEIEAESAARSRGTAAGKTSSGGVLNAIKGVFGDGSTVRMLNPKTGREGDVPADKVAAAEAEGYTRVK